MPRSLVNSLLIVEPSDLAGGGWRVLQLLASFYFLVDGFDTLLNYGDPLVGRLHLASAIICTVTCWVPLWGALAGLGLLGVTLAVPPVGADLNLLVVLPIVMFWRLRQPVAVALWAVLMVYVAANCLTFPPEERTRQLALRIVLLSVTSAIGWAVRVVVHQRRQGQQRIKELEAENARIRSDERAALARELHDVVAHQLSVISLQIMGHRDSENPEELRAALDRVEEASGSALGELQLLLEVLRDDDDGDTRTERLAEVLPPTRVAADVAQALGEHGHNVEVQVPPSADQLEASQQVTISRVLQEAATNILRHAPAGSSCALGVEVFPRRVVVDVRSPLAERGSRMPLQQLSLGYGLRGIRERVDLIGGSLNVGPEGQQWVVHMSLPRGASRGAEEL